jgi:hypothetical protein
VCSKVPGYDQPKCFVSTSNTNDMIQVFVEYLEEISQESYVLLLDRFTDIFDQICANSFLFSDERRRRG